ncbi:MAG: hypothetical protein ABI267_09890 [Ginsengibacter sp.]
MGNQNYAAQFYSDISGNADLLEKNIEEYPASSVARFMWLYHLKKNKDVRFKEVAKQTGIYLTNPLWMEYQLSQPGLADNTVNEEISQNPVLENEASETRSDDTIVEPVEEIENEVSSDFIEQRPGEETLHAAVNEEISQNPVSENESSEIKNDEAIAEPLEEIKTEIPVDSIEQKSEEETLHSAVNEKISQNPVSENESSEIKNDEAIAEPLEEIKTEVPADSIEQKSGENLPAVVNEEISQNPVLENESSEAKNNETTVEPVEKIETKNIKIASAENEKSSDETSKQDENEDEDAEILFEPLHTVDYFASQGIKLSEEALANDQLGKQVKSFTAWLKTMKKLHPGQLPEQNEVIEKIIQSSSEESNQNANVLTEAMADVLVKQGKREKAVEMYEKLSLINPSKSAYFAAKIENLKTV